MHRYVVDTARDIRRAVRVNRREATFSIAVLLTIALGLGAATAILSVVQAALIQPLPYDTASRLVQVWEQRIESGERSETSYPTYLDWSTSTRAFVGFEAFEGTNVSARPGDDAEMLRAWRVTPGFFELLGVQPEHGRAWLDGDVDDEDEVVISQRLAARLGGEEAALQGTLVLNSSPYSVIGVLPSGFHFGDDADVWLPIAAREAARSDRSNRVLGVIGRIRDGVDLSSARADLARVASAIAEDHPGEMTGRTIAVTPLREALLGDVKPILLSLLAAVAILLVITAANLAALMLLRNLNRRGELGLRVALGASRGRLVRQLFMEGVVLAVVGAILSSYVGQFGVDLMVKAIPEGLKPGMPYLADVGIDIATIAAVIVLAAAMSAVFALGPAWRAVKAVVPVEHGSRLTIGKENRRLRRILVTAQLGLTVVLLISTAQLARSFLNLLGQDTGIASPDQLLTMNIALAGPAYEDEAAQQQFYEELVAQASVLPGVLGATAVNELPFSGSGMTSFETTDRPLPVGQRPRVAMRMFAGDYFRTLGIPLREGRLVGSRDRVDTTPAIVVSASLAARLAGDGAALGKRIRLTRTGDIEWEIVGVVADVQMGTLDSAPPPTVYVNHLQAPDNRLPLVVRTAQSPASVASSLREIVRGLDPAVPVYSVATLGQQMRQSRAVFTRRFPLTIGSVFAGAALLLAIVGLYSLCAHEVLSRRREFSIRLVLGATPSGLRTVVLRDGLILALVGVCTGLLTAVPASQLVRSLLFGVSAVDPYIYGGVALGVIAAATVATALPAWRGSTSSLATVLRGDQAG